MDVDVDLLWRDFEKEKGRRITPFLDATMISIEHGKTECATVDGSAVDQGDELTAGRTANARLSGKSG